MYNYMHRHNAGYQLKNKLLCRKGNKTLKFCLLSYLNFKL